MVEDHKGHDGMLHTAQKVARDVREGRGARWSMAAIDESIGGVVHFEHGGSNRPMSSINGDPSRRGDRVDGGWRLLFDRGRSDVMAKFDGAAGRCHGQ